MDNEIYAQIKKVIDLDYDFEIGEILKLNSYAYSDILFYIIDNKEYKTFKYIKPYLNSKEKNSWAFTNTKEHLEILKENISKYPNFKNKQTNVKTNQSLELINNYILNIKLKNEIFTLDFQEKNKRKI